MNLSDFDFDFPDELVAVAPAPERDASRLLVLDRAAGARAHRSFPDVAAYFEPGDVLVLNRSKVLPARLLGKKPTGGKSELLLVRPLGGRRWLALCPSAKEGQACVYDGGAAVTFESRSASGEWTVAFDRDDVEGYLREHGRMPLPPYIRSERKKRTGHEDESFDPERYQTVYAGPEGSVAAPTAGLHFTPDVLAAVEARGARVLYVTLHVGWGTFKPVTAEDPREHVMLPERYELSAQTAAALNAARAAGKRVTACGTTSVRTLETVLAKHGAFAADAGEADLFIHPGYAFRAVDRFLTNFHQPKSTPLLMACAFAGREALLAAYREAVEKKYRLFSYGDSMLIL